MYVICMYARDMDKIIILKVNNVHYMINKITINRRVLKINKTDINVCIM
jgi:hypothetical protein